MDTTSYEELEIALQELYVIKQNQNAARNNLFTACQQGGESIKNI